MDNAVQNTLSRILIPKLRVNCPAPIHIEKGCCVFVQIDEIKKLFKFGKLSRYPLAFLLQLCLPLFLSITHCLIIAILLDPFRLLLPVPLFLHLLVMVDIFEPFRGVLEDFPESHRGHLEANKWLLHVAPDAEVYIVSDCRAFARVMF